VLLDVLAHVPAGGDHGDAPLARVVEHAAHEDRPEPPTALVRVGLGVGELHRRAVDQLVVGDADDAVVDHELVAAALVVAANLVDHRPALPGRAGQ
jgi:hypothetical protein